jgi:hypothetical protein
MVPTDQDGVGLREMKRTLPSSSSALSMQPSLDVLFRNGVPSYVMAGVLLSDAEGEVASPFTAFQWTTFANAVEPSFRILLYTGSGDGSDDVLWAKTEPAALQQALGQLGVLLAEEEAADSLSSAFQIVSCPLAFRARSAPTAEEEDALSWIDQGGVLPLSSLAGEHPQTVLTMLATAETDAREVLTLDPSLAEMTITSLLQVPLAELLPLVSSAPEL